MFCLSIDSSTSWLGKARLHDRTSPRQKSSSSLDDESIDTASMNSVLHLSNSAIVKSQSADSSSCVGCLPSSMINLDQLFCALVRLACNSDGFFTMSALVFTARSIN